MENVHKHLSILGMRVADRVTGLVGVATSVGFDLYGCVQVIVNPGIDKDGKLRDQLWFDIARLEVVSAEPVMKQPDFSSGHVAEGLKGPAEKPAAFKA
jgi:hypothetical protein